MLILESNLQLQRIGISGLQWYYIRRDLLSKMNMCVWLCTKHVSTCDITYQNGLPIWCQFSSVLCSSKSELNLIFQYTVAPVLFREAFFTRNVRVTINRWPKHIDAIIQMPQQLGGQDGHCGNFNFDISCLAKIWVPLVTFEPQSITPILPKKQPLHNPYIIYRVV